MCKKSAVNAWEMESPELEVLKSAHYATDIHSTVRADTMALYLTVRKIKRFAPVASQCHAEGRC